MPSKSKAQRDLMRAVAHSPEFAAKVKIPVSVGKEFYQADQRAGRRKAVTRAFRKVKGGEQR